MIDRIISLFFILITTISVYASDPSPILKTGFNNEFLIGVAINRNQADGTDSKGQALILKNFNAITSEQDLKWGLIHPKPTIYSFSKADDYVNFGVQNNLFVVGHTLVWHSNAPAWIFVDDNGKGLTRDALLKRMEEHINTVVGRYKGKIAGWDVVNEAFEDNGTMRKSKWFQIIGEDYIEKAFEYAHNADPKAELYYNDYNLYLNAKRNAVIKLIQRLQAKKIPIHAVGEQAHYSLVIPTVQKIEECIKDFSKLGIKVNFTELDITALPNKKKEITAEVSKIVAYDPLYDPYKKGLPDSMLLKIAVRYGDIFRVFKENSSTIQRVTFWGLTDGNSWLNGWPMPGRTNYPLLFDRNYQPKLAILNAILKPIK